jgi:hypothetical protein
MNTFNMVLKCKNIICDLVWYDASYISQLKQGDNKEHISIFQIGLNLNLFWKKMC